MKSHYRFLGIRRPRRAGTRRKHERMKAHSLSPEKSCLYINICVCLSWDDGHRYIIPRFPHPKIDVSSARRWSKKFSRHVYITTIKTRKGHGRELKSDVIENFDYISSFCLLIARRKASEFSRDVDSSWRWCKWLCLHYKLICKSLRLFTTIPLNPRKVFQEARNDFDFRRNDNSRTYTSGSTDARGV